jgi:hypothetical protein
MKKLTDKEMKKRTALLEAIKSFDFLRAYSDFHSEAQKWTVLEGQIKQIRKLQDEIERGDYS